MTTADERLAEVKARIKQVTPREVMDSQQRGQAVVLLDVRELPEVNLVKIPGAVHIPRADLESSVEAQVPRDARVVIYCASGNRSAFAAETLGAMGYTNVASLSTGIRGWVNDGGEVE